MHNLIHAFDLQPQHHTTLWPILIFRPTKGRRLSWPDTHHKRFACLRDITAKQIRNRTDRTKLYVYMQLMTIVDGDEDDDEDDDEQYYL